MAPWKIAIAAVAAIAAVLGGYAGYWHYLAAQIEPAVAAWAEEQRGRGYKIGYEAIVISGFPGTFRIRVTGPVLARPGDETPWEWRAAAVESGGGPFNFRELGYEVAGGGKLVYQPPGAPGPLTATARAAGGNIFLDADGEPERGLIKLDGLHLAMPDGKSEIRAARARIETHHRPARGPAGRNGSLSLAWVLDGLDLPPAQAGPLGPRVERFSGETVLEGTGPGLLQTKTMREAVTAWRDGDGRLVVQGMVLEWGPLSLSTNGTVGLDEKFRPTGKLQTLVSGYRETALALVRAGVIKLKEASAALIALDLLSREPEGGGPREIRLPLTAGNGELFIGPFRVVKLPPLNFDR